MLFKLRVRISRSCSRNQYDGTVFHLPAVFPQFFCREIRQMLSAILLSCLVTELQKPLTVLEPRTDFRGCFLWFCNLLAETNNSVLGAVLLSCLVSELKKPSSLGLEPRIVFRACGLVPVISSPKQMTLVLAHFFCRIKFPSYRNHLHWDSNPGAILSEVSVIF
jgi:hypothetical protein